MGQAAINSEDIGQTFKAIAEYTPMRNNLFKYAWKENQDAGSIFIRPLFDIGAYGGFLSLERLARFCKWPLFC